MYVNFSTLTQSINTKILLKYPTKLLHGTDTYCRIGLRELCRNNLGNFEASYYSGIIPEYWGIIELKTEIIVKY